MSDKDTLQNIKKLRELTGVGFKDCKIAIDENNGDLEKSIDFLRKKGIAKASKKMNRTASEGLVLVHEEKNQISLIEINSETDFVAKNKDFIIFCKEISELNFKVKGDLNQLNETKMKSGSMVKDALVDLIAKIGEKISIRRAKFFDDNDGLNFYYVHTQVENKIGKIISVVKLSNVSENKKDIGNKICMHITASNPISLDRKDLDKNIIKKETEIIKEELINSGKKGDIIEKISKGKINKFIADNTLINQAWIMDPKKTVSDILKESSVNSQIKIIDFVRFKVGEGV